jgi:hypothetical protein
MCWISVFLAVYTLKSLVRGYSWVLFVLNCVFGLELKFVWCCSQVGRKQ